MAKEIRSWQANDGSLHPTECEAVTRDLEMIVKASPLNENEPYARMLVTWLISEAPLIRKTLEAYERGCPRAEVSREASPSQESDQLNQKRPGVHMAAVEARLIGHTPGCNARATGFFKDCNCGHYSKQEIADFARLSEEID